MNIEIKRSKKAGKKFDGVIDGKKTVSFGATGYSDYTQHKDPERKRRYINRHKKEENWNDPKTPGFYGKHILWNQQSLRTSEADANKRFKNLSIRLMT